MLKNSILQKLLALALVLAMVLSLAVPAIAQEEEDPYLPPDQNEGSEGINIITNPGFEEGEGAWEKFGGGKPTISDEVVHGGEKAMKLDDQHVKYTGWVRVGNGETYKFGAWVYGKATLASAMLRGDGGIEYAYHVEGGEDGKWTYLEGFMTVNNSSVTHIDMTIVKGEGTVYVDDVTMNMVVHNMLRDPGFEDGGKTWIQFGDAPVTVTDEVVHSGSKAMVIQSLPAKYGSWIEVNEGQMFTLSVWVYGRATLVSAMMKEDGTVEYVYHHEDGEDGKWTQLKATMLIGAGYTRVDFSIVNAGNKVYVDDAFMGYLGGGGKNSGEMPAAPATGDGGGSGLPEIYGDNRIGNADFELGAGGWLYFDNTTVKTDKENAYNGTSSLVSGTGNGGVRTEGIAVDDGVYKTGAWVYGPARLQLALFNNDGSVDYLELDVGGAEGKWTYLEGKFYVPGSKVNAVSVIFVTSSERILIDDVTLNKQGEQPSEEKEEEIFGDNKLDNASFEMGASDWMYFNDTTGEVDPNGYNGNSALIMSSGKGGVKSPGIEVSEGTYKTGAWVYGNASMKLAVFKRDGSIEYVDVASGGKAGEWTYLEGIYDVAGSDVAAVSIIFQTDSDRILIDEVTLNKKGETPTEQPPEQPPEEEATYGENLLNGAGFESGATDWHYFVNDAIGETDNANGYTGNSSLIMGSGKGGVKSPGISVSEGSYKTGAWVYGPAIMQLAVFKTNGAIEYYDITAGGAADTWTYLEGSFDISGTDVTSVVVLFLTSAERILIDDVTVNKKNDNKETAGENLIKNADFEKDASGWKTFSGAAVQTTTEEVHEGEQAVKIAQSDPVTLNELIEIKNEIVYQLTAWVYGKVNVFGVLYDQNNNLLGYYNNWQPFITAGTDGEWTEISGEVLIGDANITQFNIEFRPVESDVYLDDVSFAQKEAEQAALLAEETVADAAAEQLDAAPAETGEAPTAAEETPEVTEETPEVTEETPAATEEAPVVEE